MAHYTVLFTLQVFAWLSCHYSSCLWLQQSMICQHIKLQTLILNGSLHSIFPSHVFTWLWCIFHVYDYSRGIFSFTTEKPRSKLRIWQDQSGKFDISLRYLQKWPGYTKAPHELWVGYSTPRIHRLRGTLNAGSHHHVVAAQEHFLNVVSQECIQCARTSWCAANGMFYLLNEFHEGDKDLSDVAWIWRAHQQLLSLLWLSSLIIFLSTYNQDSLLFDKYFLVSTIYWTKNSNTPSRL